MAKPSMPNVHCCALTKKCRGPRTTRVLALIKAVEALFIQPLKNYSPRAAVLDSKKVWVKLKEEIIIKGKFGHRKKIF